MPKIIRLNILLVTIFCFIPGIAFAADARNAVLKVFVTANSMDYYRPWQSHGIASKSGSAVVLSGRRILTNAHVVSDQTFIQVRKESDPKKYTAKLVAIGHDCDLALLRVDDEKFFEGIEEIEVGNLPELQDTVTVVGYPTGGDKISITKGVVSRVEIVNYIQSSRKLLAVQIDAAINPGNSGGPVVKDGKLVGIAMQGIVESQNIGYMIPTPIIEHFFEDLADGQYDGFPALGVDFLNTENKTFRKFYDIEKKEGGIYVKFVIPKMSADGYLKEGDIILAVDNIPIGVDGTFKFRGKERLGLSYLISDKQLGEDINIQISRKGKVKNINVKMIKFSELVPAPKYFTKPPYYVYGGLVFTVLSSDLLRSWGNRWWESSPIDFLYYVMGRGRLNEELVDEKVVLLSVLPDDINIGYHHYQNQVIEKVNGKKIKSLKDLVTMLNNENRKYATIETFQKLKIILNTAGIDAVNTEILKRNNIPFQYSDDVAQWLAN